jgi:S1-C subfamily serine protease
MNLKRKLIIFTVGALASLGAALLGAYLILNAGQFHADYLRDKVGSNVFLMHSVQGRPVGTGFLLNTEKRGQVLISNAHVCDTAGDLVKLSKDDEIGSAVKIKKDVENDLCMLSKPKGFKATAGLDLDAKVVKGENVAVLGHPQAMPLTLSRGQIISRGMLAVGSPIMDEEQLKSCEASGGEPKFSLFFVVCVRQYDAYFTTVPGIAGNSGSPVVNFWGEVVAVIFASGPANWLSAIPGDKLKAFISE